MYCGYLILHSCQMFCVTLIRCFWHLLTVGAGESAFTSLLEPVTVISHVLTIHTLSIFVVLMLLEVFSCGCITILTCIISEAWQTSSVLRFGGFGLRSCETCRCGCPLVLLLSLTQFSMKYWLHSNLFLTQPPSPHLTSPQPLSPALPSFSHLTLTMKNTKL